MGKKKRPFIDKKTSQSFRLIHKSLRDPEEEDEEDLEQLDEVTSAAAAEGGARKKLDGRKRLEEQRKLGVYFDDGYDYLQHLRDPEDDTLVLDPIQQKHAPAMDLEAHRPPPSRFDPELEEDIGLSRGPVLAAPPFAMATAARPDDDLEGDPDVIECMDENFAEFVDVENFDEFEDDFILQANGGKPVHRLDEEDAGSGDDDGTEKEEDDDGEGDWEDCDSDENGSDDGGEMTDSGDESRVRSGMPAADVYDDDYHRRKLGLDAPEGAGQSRFNNYPMSASTKKRSEGLQLLDARFDKFMERWDEEDDMARLHGSSAVDQFEPDHPFVAERMQKLVEQYQAGSHSKAPLEALMAGDEHSGSQEYKRSMAAIADHYRYENEQEEEYGEETEMVYIPRKPQFDVESIRSVSSQSSSRRRMPGVIRPPAKVKSESASGQATPAQVEVPSVITLDKKTGFPTGVLHEKPKKPAAEAEPEEAEQEEVVLVRRKGESRDERKERKKATKDCHKDRRVEKKATKVAFQTERKRQTVQSVNRGPAGVAM